ncbi:MAG: hypothetical protein V4718_00660 [Pseudomonadota bacterium]
MTATDTPNPTSAGACTATADATPAAPAPFKLKVQARLVAAIAQFKADDDIRYYLNGVYVEPIPGGVLIIATNGHAMGIWRDPDGIASRPAILRIDPALQKACKAEQDATLELVDERLVVRTEFGMESYAQPRGGKSQNDWEIEGKFPIWAKVVPESCDADRAVDGINPLYMAKVHKALDIAGHHSGGRVTMRQADANKGISVTCAKNTNFFAVIMPMRDSEPNYPNWLKEYRPAALAAAAEREKASKALDAEIAATPAPAAPTTDEPPAVGQPWPSQGGIYLGIHNNQHLVAMTAPECNFKGAWGEYDQNVTGAQSRTDGLANTKAMAEAGSAIAKRVLALAIDGHADLFIPSQTQLQHAYTAAPQAFEKSGWYWSSTQSSSNLAFVQDFEDGYSSWIIKGYELRVRAFRVIQLENLTT